MINLITDEQLTAAAIDVQFPEYIREELLADEPAGSFLRKYALLEHFPERFGAIEGVNIYYNKYYWFLKFYQAYRNTQGSNMSMEQHEFKIIEEGERYDDIDWGIMEEITNEFK